MLYGTSILRTKSVKPYIVSRRRREWHRFFVCVSENPGIRFTSDRAWIPPRWCCKAIEMMGMKWTIQMPDNNSQENWGGLLKSITYEFGSFQTKKILRKCLIFIVSLIPILHNLYRKKSRFMEELKGSCQFVVI